MDGFRRWKKANESLLSKTDSDGKPINFYKDKGGRMVFTHPRKWIQIADSQNLKKIAEGYSLLTGFNQSFEINFKNMTDEKILKI